jgi:hypothetical protein
MHSIKYDFDANKAVVMLDWSRKTKGLPTNIKKMPLANPDKLSTLPYPYGKVTEGGHLLMMAAARPTARPAQSKSMWMLSVKSPSEPVTKP